LTSLTWTSRKITPNVRPGLAAPSVTGRRRWLAPGWHATCWAHRHAPHAKGAGSGTYRSSRCSSSHIPSGAQPCPTLRPRLTPLLRPHSATSRWRRRRAHAGWPRRARGPPPARGQQRCRGRGATPAEGAWAARRAPQPAHRSSVEGAGLAASGLMHSGRALSGGGVVTVKLPQSQVWRRGARQRTRQHRYCTGDEEKWQVQKTGWRVRLPWGRAGQGSTVGASIEWGAGWGRRWAAVKVKTWLSHGPAPEQAQCQLARAQGVAGSWRAPTRHRGARSGCRARSKGIDQSGGPAAGCSAPVPPPRAAGRRGGGRVGRLHRGLGCILRGRGRGAVGRRWGEEGARRRAAGPTKAGPAQTSANQ
jgi:hypothetical protein